MKPNKKIIEKLKILSELSYDNQVGISEKGNYFVRLSKPTKVDTTVELKPLTITRGTYNKMFVKRPIKYETHQHMVLMNKNGKIMLGQPKNSPNGFRKGCYWEVVTTSNFHKKARWMTCEGKDPIEFRKNMVKLVFCNSKAKWLLDMPFWILERGIDHRIVLNYASLTEMRKDLGYQFITDKIFLNLLTHIKQEDVDPFASEDEDDTSPTKQKRPVNKDFVSNLFTIILYGKFFSLQSRKNLIIVLLNLVANKSDKDLRYCFDDLSNDMTNYIKRRKADGKAPIELPNNFKDLVTDLTAELAADDSVDQEDEDLPF